MTLRHATIRSVNVGIARPLMVGGRPVMSAMDKRGQTGEVHVGALGLAGDEQVELAYHGGISQAVYAYPIEHLPFWQARRAAQAPGLFETPLEMGGLGENLSIEGLLEHEVFVGDQLVGANVVFRVTQHREPCAKLNAVLGYATAAKEMVAEARTGFYLRVEQTGTLQAGDCLALHPGRQEISVADMARSKWARHARD